MHEAGIARSIAAALRGRDLAGGRVVVHVSGGHHEPADFDASLLAHLQAEAPDFAPFVEIVHDPSERLCVACGGQFRAVLSQDPCPACGGAGLPMLENETVEVELVR